MNRMTTRCLAVVVGLALAAAFTPPTALAQSVKSLRGNISIPDTTKPPEIYRQDSPKQFAKAYRQQPPLTTHKEEKYQINLKVNQCIRCHDWPYNIEENSPKMSEGHYVGNAGAPSNKVSGRRYFCNQCHVTQRQARPLVRNTFKPAHRLD